MRMNGGKLVTRPEVTDVGGELPLTSFDMSPTLAWQLSNFVCSEKKRLHTQVSEREREGLFNRPLNAMMSL